MKKPTWGMRPTLIFALDYIGSHRLSGTYPHRTSCPVSMSTAKTLVALRLAMWIDPKNNKKGIMLTWEGERRWSARHPYSKYAVSVPKYLRGTASDT